MENLQIFLLHGPDPPRLFSLRIFDRKILKNLKHFHDCSDQGLALIFEKSKLC